MQRASPLDEAERRESGPIESVIPLTEPRVPSFADRRLTESNQAWLGKIVDQRYRVIDVVGRGGMGVVYKVEHLRMGKIAAMKVLHRDLAQESDVVQRFEREALAVSRLNHPNTVQVFDFGTAQGALYLIMEFVRGQDLQRILDRDGPMPWARLAPLLIQICGALQEAHELGIVHRDLKPENVLITRATGGRDFAKVLDFGLAKFETRESPGNETDRSKIIGTPYFMAPEQIRGDEVDARTDIYSLGAMMFRMLTGEYLYEAKSAVGVLTKHLTSDIDAPSERVPQLGIDPRVDAICMRALAKEADDRWQSVAQMSAAIEEAFNELVIDASDVRGGRSGRTVAALVAGGTESGEMSRVELRRADLDAYERSLRRGRFAMIAGTILFVLGLAGVAVWWQLREQPPRTTELEPNDDLAQANRIAAGKPVTGLLGRRRSPTEPDRDLFIIRWPQTSQRLVTVKTTALPNIDVQFTLRTSDGTSLVTTDEGGLAAAESLHRRRITGPLVIEVGQTMAPGQVTPTENVSDLYTLAVTEDAEDPSWESEPNGGDAEATPIASGSAVHGYLDNRRDVDVLRYTGPAGNVHITLAADGLPCAWRRDDGVAHAPGAVDLALRTGELLRLERTDADRPHGADLPGRDSTWTMTIQPR